MSNAFLVQIALESYERLTTQREYYNPNWHAKKRDTDHGEIQPGDSVFFYCTGVPAKFPSTQGVWPLSLTSNPSPPTRHY